mmetsp:Transcript_7662/g.11378  ORF Transcript_7662/g.11378 Transcript_7662/m.11378 type:complete len:716 (+) Transcript_7662:37-2184(+)
MANHESVRTLNRIIIDCGIKNSTIQSLKDCSPSMFVVLTEKLFASRVPNVIRNPSHSKHHVSNMRAVLNFLRKKIHLNDLYEVFDYYPERNEKALKYIITVYEKLAKAVLNQPLSEDAPSSVSSLKEKKDNILSDVSSELTDPSVRFGTNRSLDQLSFKTPSSFESLLDVEKKKKKKSKAESIPITVQPLTQALLKEINGKLADERIENSEKSLREQLEKQDRDYHENAKLLEEIERKTKALYDEVNHIHIDEEGNPIEWHIEDDDDSDIQYKHGNPLLQNRPSNDIEDSDFDSDSDIDDDDLREEDREIDQLLKDSLQDISTTQKDMVDDNYTKSRKHVFEKIDNQSSRHYDIEDPDSELSRKMRRQTLSDIRGDLNQSAALDDSISQSLLQRKMRPRSSKPYSSKHGRTALETEKTIQKLKKSSRPHSASYNRYSSARKPSSTRKPLSSRKPSSTSRKVTTNPSKTASRVNESLSALKSDPSSATNKSRSSSVKHRRRSSKKSSSKKKKSLKSRSRHRSSPALFPPHSDKYKMLYMRFLNDYLTGKSQVKPSIAVRNYLRDEKIEVLRERREVEDEERAFQSANKWKENLEERVALRQSRQWNRLKQETARDERIRSRLAEKKKAEKRSAKLASMQHFYSSQIGMLKELIAADRSRAAKEHRARILAQDKASRDLRSKERRMRSRIRKKYLSKQRQSVLKSMPNREFDTALKI